MNNNTTRKGWRHPNHKGKPNPGHKKQQKSRYTIPKSQDHRQQQQQTSIPQNQVIFSESTIEKIKELQEDIQEFRKAEIKYNLSGHKSLHNEAYTQRKKCEDELYEVTHPLKPRKKMDTSWISMFCLPCLICFSCLCVISTGAVGEVELNKNRNAKITEDLGKLGGDIIHDIKSKYSRSSKR